MHALNRGDHTLPVIMENHLHRLVGDELGGRAMMPCILLALPSPALSFMAGVPDAGKLTGDRRRRGVSGRDHSGIWLRNAAAGLCLLAAAAAVVSFTAQYRMVEATRRLAVVAGLEAAIPDAAALVFACLGIALALHGRRAIRARILNVAAVGTSVFMNAIAAAPGWRNLAIWAMPPIAYALASDTLISVVRAWALARHQHLHAAFAGDSASPLQAVLSPHVARARGETKTARFLSLVAERHGPLASVPLDRVASISAALAPMADLNTGAARTALRKALLAAQNGDPR